MNIYVGNLSFSATPDDLRDLFEQFGAVKGASIISDKFTGKSRGFGFVEMADDNQAQKAITSTNGADFNGRRLVVNEAKPREERAPRRDFRGDSRDRGGYRGSDRY